MKKIFATLIIVLFGCCANATVVIGVSLSKVDENSEVTDFSVKTVKTVKFDSGLTFEKDSVLNMEIVKIIPAKHFKRNAYIIAKPVGIDFGILELSEKDKNLEAKTYWFKQISASDKLKKAGAYAGKKAVNLALPGSEQIVQFSKGFIVPEEGKTRLQSAFGNFTDSLPTKYLKKGSSLNINEGDKIVMKFYNSKRKSETDSESEPEAEPETESQEEQ